MSTKRSLANWSIEGLEKQVRQCNTEISIWPKDHDHAGLAWIKAERKKILAELARRKQASASVATDTNASKGT
jgi:hypothetical protein